MTFEEIIEIELSSFRNTLSKLYREQPYTDEGTPADMATIYLVITEFEKWKEKFLINIL